MENIQLKNFAEVIDLWPSKSSLAEDLEVSQKVVYQWHSRKQIPGYHWNAILQSARKNKIRGLSLKLFADLSAEKNSQ